MKADLDTCYHWRGRAFGPGATEIPNDLAAALGLAEPSASDPEPQAIAPAEADQSPKIPAALKLINGVDVYREIQVIPTIGAGAAKLIRANRPGGGYSSLEQVWDLCPQVLKSPYTTDPEQVRGWGAE